jgi:phosphoribosylformylglycinamidine synthase
MKAKVTVKLKSGVLDPQGKAICHAAHALGIGEVEEVRVGKVFEIQFSGKDPEWAQQKLKELADKLLANTVMENFHIDLE